MLAAITDKTKMRKKMLKRLYPTKMLNSVYELPIEELKSQGIKGIIFDIDNTLVPYDVPEPTDKILALFEALQKEGFKLTLVSNNAADRVIKFNEKLKVLALHKAQKPLKKNFKKALEMMACKEEEAVIVGDQIFTDVYGGNRAGLRTYLVSPISDKDEWQVRMKRKLEKVVIRSYERKQQRNASKDHC